MRCETAQRQLSAAMHVPSPVPADARRHAERCPVCSRFQRELHRLHQVVRIEAATPVPDLVPSIMARVAAERLGEAVPVRRPRRGPERFRDPARRAIAMAVAAGLVVGFFLGAGGVLPNRGEGTSALASEIPHRLVQAAVGLRGYRATFDLTERNWSPAVPLRRFRADVWFRAPEDLRVIVRDVSTYPSPAWPRNDLQLVTNGRAWAELGPNPCPPAELPACKPDTIDRTVVHRAPFDSETPAPTDLIVPMTVLAAAHRVHVIGPDTIAGRPAEAVSLDYEDATPLLASLQFLGSWRPFYPQDRVVLWLDRSTWFPLRFEVFPAPGTERAQWAAQFGIEGDRPDRPSFTASVGSLSIGVPPASTFGVPSSPGAVNEGFRQGLAPGLAAAGLPGGLHLVRSGRFPRTTARPYAESVAAYARGLAWTTVASVTDWKRHNLFGVGDFAERVRLGNGGVGYYEPATSMQPRRLALHTGHGELLLSSNLPAAQLLASASALPERGLAAPRSWFVRRWSGGVVRSGLTPEQAVARSQFRVLEPAFLPPGYRAAAAQAVDAPRIRGVTIVYRRPAAELDGVGLRLYQARGASLPPPQSVSEEAVRVRGVAGRWSADAHLLEWVESGVYRSLQSPALGLSTLVRVADSLRFARRP